MLLHLAAQVEAGHPGAVPRHRHAVRPDAGLPQAAWPQRLGLTDVRDLRPHYPGPGRRRPRGQPLADRHRRLLRHPQGAAAGPGAGRLRRLDHRPQALPRRRPPAPAGGRAGRAARSSSIPLANWAKAELDAYVAEHDLPAHPLVPRASRRSAAGPAPSRWKRARTSAPAAGRARTRPNAASISPARRAPSTNVGGDI